MSLILALDQGTTSTRAILFDATGHQVASASTPLTQYFPGPGWVEHDADEIHQASRRVLREALDLAHRTPSEVAAIGITNQRETVVLWNRSTGQPLGKAIVWQDRRTASHCEALLAEGHESLIRARTGLLLDPYFSATKIAWLIEHHGARAAAERGDVLAGTIDSWLIWCFSQGRCHLTDATNASRTMLFDIHRQCWDGELLRLFRIPRCMLPEVTDCGATFCTSDVLGGSTRIGAAIGDQQAAAIGQGCLRPGMAKATFGTGCFLLVHCGEQAPISQHRLLTTIASRSDARCCYALEGSVFNAGSVMTWLRDSLHAFSDVSACEALAASAHRGHGLHMVPAFTGLGAPYWDPHARGAIMGLSRDSSLADIVHAALASVAFQVCDLFRAMAADSVVPNEVRVDGGMARNDLLMQMLADYSGIPVLRPQNTETTALGAALLAGCTVGIYPRLEDAVQVWALERRFIPAITAARRDDLHAGWQASVAMVRQGRTP